MQTIARWSHLSSFVPQYSRIIKTNSQHCAQDYKAYSYVIDQFHQFIIQKCPACIYQHSKVAMVQLSILISPLGHLKGQTVSLNSPLDHFYYFLYVSPSKTAIIGQTFYHLYLINRYIKFYNQLHSLVIFYSSMIFKPSYLHKYRHSCLISPLGVSNWACNNKNHKIQLPHIPLVD
jgi:hypothetical protein